MIQTVYAKNHKGFLTVVFRSHEKHELISRLSTNPETSYVFKTTTSVRKFSTNSIRGDYPNGILDGQSRRSTRVSQTSNRSSLIQKIRSSRESSMRSFINESNRGSNQSCNSDPNESKGNFQDILKLRIVIEILELTSL